MWGRIIWIVGLVLVAVIVASVVSPWFDLHPTALRTSKRAIVHFSFAVPLFLLSAPPLCSTCLTKLCTLQLRQAYDIVARDCARLC